MKFSLPGFGKSVLVGLDIGSSSVKAVEIAMKGKDKGFELRSLGILTLNPLDLALHLYPLTPDSLHPPEEIFRPQKEAAVSSLRPDESHLMR